MIIDIKPVPIKESNNNQKHAVDNFSNIPICSITMTYTI